MPRLIFVLAFVILISGLVVFVLKKESPAAQQVINRVNDSIQNEVQPSPSPVPFYDLTIPYLKSQTYQSQLGSLEKFSETSTYTSYLTYYTSDNLRINGLLTQPKGEPPAGGWPGIVFIHGYIAPTTYRTQGPQYTGYVDYLARNGFVVFKIDLRGHGSSEGEPGGAYYSSDYNIDALNAYAALQSTAFVNPQRIGLWGHSMAGNVVMRTVAAKPDIPAAVIWAGAVYSYEDFQKYGIRDNSYRPPGMSTQRQRRRDELFKAHGQFSKDSSFWRQVAPTNYLSEIKTALQVHHAVDDAVVNIGYSRDLNSLLDNTSITHELFEYRTGGHNLTGTSFNQAMQRTVEFFKNHL
jgi:dipeptidyl aminopeptidase/acylaminoacyl peptidase